MKLNEEAFQEESHSHEQCNCAFDETDKKNLHKFAGVISLIAMYLKSGKVDRRIAILAAGDIEDFARIFRMSLESGK